MSCIIYLRSYPAYIKLKNKLLHVFQKVEGPAPYQGASLERCPVRGSAGPTSPFSPLSLLPTLHLVWCGSAESSRSCTGQESSQRKETVLISSEKQVLTCHYPIQKETKKPNNRRPFWRGEEKKFQINYGRWSLGDGQVWQFFQEYKSFADGQCN